jgi:transposase
MIIKEAKTKRDWREERRRRAWELKQKGWSQARIAEALGVTPGAVSQWMKRARQGQKGFKALRARKSPGAPRGLTAKQLAQLPKLLLRGAQAWGFRGDLWTRARVGEVIKREFGVGYHQTHIGRLLRQIGWSVQQPETKAAQRDEAQIQQWVNERWPMIKKKPAPKAGKSSG